MNVLLLLAVVLPATLAPLVALRSRVRPSALRLAPWAAAPALLLALRPEAIEPAAFPWLLLGARIGLDLTGQLFLLFTALLWTVAGVYARAYHAEDPQRHRFFTFFLLTMSGNLALVAAQDLVTFYVGFALLTFAAYPLVIHWGDAYARRAGRVYIVMAVAGETMLLAAFVLAALVAGGLEVSAVAAAVAASPWRALTVALFLAGFGIKAGAVPLHVWLPLAHPVAPTPASAVLSGAMIKAGLLGWLRFLPLGHAELAEWGALLIALGLLAAFFGVLIGVTQDDPKTALAYSSISQMGIINVAVGVGLANPEAWTAALAACLVYAVHHGLAKGALFLGVGVAAATAAHRVGRRLALAGLALAALAVAGAPLTSGMVAKAYLKQVAPLSPAGWYHLLEMLLPLTAVGTTLLMGRFLWLVAFAAREEEHHAPGPGLWLPWALLLAAVAGVAWALPRYYPLGVQPPALLYPGGFLESAWPVLTGLLLIALALALAPRLQPAQRRLRIAAGDVLLLVEWLAERLTGSLRARRVRTPRNPVALLAARWYSVYARGPEPTAVVRLEARLTRWAVGGLGAVLLGVVLFGLLLLG